MADPISKTNIDNPRHEISYSRSAEDLARVAQHLKVVYPRIPIFCLGESVGAGVTVRAAADHPDLFEGIILASAGTTPHFFNMQMVAPDLVKGLSDLDRPLDVSDYITKYSSEDPRITHEMVNDPLSRTMLTGKEILQTAAFIHKTPHNAKQLAPNMSVLLINGADDAIVRAESTQEIMKNIPSRDKKMVVVPNCGHLLLGTAYLKKSGSDYHLQNGSSTKQIPVKQQPLAPSRSTDRTLRGNSLLVLSDLCTRLALGIASSCIEPKYNGTT